MDAVVTKTRKEMGRFVAAFVTARRCGSVDTMRRDSLTLADPLGGMPHADLRCTKSLSRMREPVNRNGSHVVRSTPLWYTHTLHEGALRLA